MKKILAILLLLAIAGGGGWYWNARRQAQRPPEVLATAKLARGEVRKALESTGIIKAEVGAIVKIGSRATGVINKMLVKVGDRVKKGDLIAVIDDRELKAQLVEGEARIRRLKAEAERVEVVFPLQISEARSQLQTEKVRLDYAKLIVERQRKLVEADLQARDILDQAERDLKVVAEQIDARAATLDRLEQEYEQEKIKAVKNVAEAEATLDAIKVRISYTLIKSPIDGVVSQVTSQEGETVVSGLQVSNLITVLDPLSLEMWIYVDETDVGQVQRGMPVEFRVDAYRERVFHGVIDQIYPQPEIRDNIVYYQAIVKLDPEQAAELRPEMTTQCKVIVESRKDVLALPNEALKWVGDRQVIFRVKDGGAVEEVKPDLGLQGLNTSEVLSGLSEGDTVATQLVLRGQTAAKQGEGGSAPAGGGGRPR